MHKCMLHRAGDILAIQFVQEMAMLGVGGDFRGVMYMWVVIYICSSKLVLHLANLWWNNYANRIENRTFPNLVMVIEAACELIPSHET